MTTSFTITYICIYVCITGFWWVNLWVPLRYDCDFVMCSRPSNGWYLENFHQNYYHVKATEPHWRRVKLRLAQCNGLMQQVIVDHVLSYHIALLDHTQWRKNGPNNIENKKHSGSTEVTTGFGPATYRTYVIWWLWCHKHLPFMTNHHERILT